MVKYRFDASTFYDSSVIRADYPSSSKEKDYRGLFWALQVDRILKDNMSAGE